MFKLSKMQIYKEPGRIIVMKDDKKLDVNVFDEIDGNPLPYKTKEFVPVISHEYDDIIDLPRPEPGAGHPRMSMEKRAAQFSPFAALSGHKESVLEVERRTESFIDLTESEKEVIDLKLQALLAGKAEESEICVTFFVPDERKEGGAYKNHIGSIKKIDEYNRMLVMTDGKKIPIDSLYDIQADFLDHF